MKSKKQPTVKELKGKQILLKYIVRDTPPIKGLKRLNYYTSLNEEDRDGEVYYMRSYRRPIDSESLNRMVKNGQIIKLMHPVEVAYEKDVWLNDAGQVLLLKGYAPWEDSNAKPIASPKEFNPARHAMKNISVDTKPYYQIVEE